MGVLSIFSQTKNLIPFLFFGLIIINVLVHCIQNDQEPTVDQIPFCDEEIITNRDVSRR